MTEQSAPPSNADLTLALAKANVAINDMADVIQSFLKLAAEGGFQITQESGRKIALALDVSILVTIENGRLIRRMAAGGGNG